MCRGSRTKSGKSRPDAVGLTRRHNAIPDFGLAMPDHLDEGWLSLKQPPYTSRMRNPEWLQHTTVLSALAVAAA
jgi:hypothetical protein